MTPTFTFRRGHAPLLVSMPHVGTHVPDHIAAGMTDAALKLPDTDWHLERLYDFLDELGASVIAATHSRYVIDLNRPTDNANLYPGQDTTGLCPVDTFSKEPVYRDGKVPNDAEIERRIHAYYMPYHMRVEEELERIRDAHGIAMLWDAHSICSVVPRFFEGRLPDFNIGTASGTSCDSQLGERLLQAAQEATGYSAVLNGRFKGGHITRFYGQPQQNIHAVQLELAEATYMEEAHPYRFDETLANRVRPVLRRFIELMLDHARTHATTPATR
jgi:N-formylglutamate deformylase